MWPINICLSMEYLIVCNIWTSGDDHSLCLYVSCKHTQKSHKQTVLVIIANTQMVRDRLGTSRWSVSIAGQLSLIISQIGTPSGLQGSAERVSIPSARYYARAGWLVFTWYHRMWRTQYITNVTNKSMLWHMPSCINEEHCTNRYAKIIYNLSS
jgi:hypothetical protein